MSMGTDKDQDLALRDEDAVNVVGGKRAKAAHKTTWTTLPNQAVASAGVVNTPSPPSAPAGTPVDPDDPNANIEC